MQGLEETKDENLLSAKGGREVCGRGRGEGEGGPGW